MNALTIVEWPSFFKASDWPNGVLEYMNISIFVSLFQLRKESCVPMWPSSDYGAHVRAVGNSRHSTQCGKRLSDATDMHVDSVSNMIKVMAAAEQIKSVGGIGIYFDTNTPMLHLDNRPVRLVWLRTKAGKYVYRENDVKKFYLILAEQIKCDKRHGNN